MRLKREIKIIISLFYMTCSSARQLVLSLFPGTPRATRLVILYYHGVTADERANFAQQLDTVVRHSKVVHADYCNPTIENGLHVAITFDDAFENLLSNVIPELEKRSLPATIFVPSGNLGAFPDWEMLEIHEREADEIMTGNQICAIASDRIRIGSHTVSHPRLSTLDSNQLEFELETSKSELEALLGIQISTLSFPYGDYDERVVEVASAKGYKFVYSISPETLDASSKHTKRGRVAVSPNDGRLEFYLKMVGAYSWMPHASKLKGNFSPIIREVHQ